MAVELPCAKRSTVAEPLPRPQSDLARESLKDPFRLDFLSVAADANEREIEAALVQHMTRFLLVIELKAGDFKPGQTPVFLQNASSSNTLDNSAASTAPGAAPVTAMDWIFGSTDEWQMIAASLGPPDGGSPGTRASVTNIDGHDHATPVAPSADAM